MALIIPPTTPAFIRTAWTPPAQNQVNRSGWTGARKVVRLPGAGLWRVSAALQGIAREIEAWPWKAFLAALEGDANTFLMPYCRNQWHEPVFAPTVPGGAAQGVTQMPVQGLGTGNTNPRLRAGQVVSLQLPSGNYQMLMLTQDLTPPDAATPTATMYFRGALREAIPGGTPIEFDNPVCEMAMTRSDTPIPNDEGVYNFAFDAEEAF